MTLTFDLWPWNSIGFQTFSRYMCVQKNFIRLSAAVHELSTVYSVNFGQLYTLIANISGTDQAIDKRKTALSTTIFFHVRRKQFGKLRSENLVLWPWLLPLKLNRFRAVVNVHARAKFHQAECSGLWVIVRRKKKNDENNTVGRYRADSNEFLNPFNVVHWPTETLRDESAFNQCLRLVDAGERWDSCCGYDYTVQLTVSATLVESAFSYPATVLKNGCKILQEMF